MEKKGVLYPSLSTTHRALPQDRDRDHLPDRWERDVTAAAGLAPSLTRLSSTTDDEDDGHSVEKGDGLSAFEEYRGFFVQGKHARTDELEDETPVLEGKGTVQNNRGGPFKKDVFIEDPDKLFKAYGQRTATYGFSAHGILPAESLEPSPGDDPKLTGQINHWTPTASEYQSQVSTSSVQYRLKIVSDPQLKVYGEAQVDHFRDAAVVKFNLPLLRERLTSADLYRMSFKDSRITTLEQTLIAHELGHRLTLLHPLVTASVASAAANTGSTLPAGTMAEVFDSSTMRYVPEEGRVLQVLPVKARIIAEVKVGKGLSTRIFPLRYPVQMSFPALAEKPVRFALLTWIFTPVARANS